jgi:hypothetical protein
LPSSFRYLFVCTTYLRISRHEEEENNKDRFPLYA